MCIVFSLERQLKRENKGAKKANVAMKVCKYSRDSYLNLSLISGVHRKGIFSLLNENGGVGMSRHDIRGG